eukprot:13150591-Alexandrium_andersonii.AAC.1
METSNHALASLEPLAWILAATCSGHFIDLPARELAGVNDLWNNGWRPTRVRKCVNADAQLESHTHYNTPRPAQ